MMDHQALRQVANCKLAAAAKTDFGLATISRSCWLVTGGRARSTLHLRVALTLSK
jgi:hypothetical protein